jgi:hypothetical protein
MLTRTPMAKKKADEPVREPEDERQTTAKVPAELLRKANMVVFHRKRANPDYTVYEYLKSILLPAVERDYAAVIREESHGG